MNKLTQTITKQSHHLLNIYCTAGYPKLEDTVRVLKALQNAGVDIIEIGIPFSDPLADGPTIQQSNDIALNNGISIPKLFEQLQNIRETVTVPLILMGYLNPILQYGFEAFCEQCNKIGIDGLIIPDLPLYEYITHYKPIFTKYNLSNICLITPKTSAERIKEIDDQSSGFIYAVSSSSTTGTKDKAISNNHFFEQLKTMDLKNPVLIGFNIKDNATFTNACKYANGAIIGSAFIRAIDKTENLDNDIRSFVNGVKKIKSDN